MLQEEPLTLQRENLAVQNIKDILFSLFGGPILKVLDPNADLL
jgi:hypothetical protein